MLTKRIEASKFWERKWEYWQRSMRRRAREICILLYHKRTWERACHFEYSIHAKELGPILLSHQIKKYPDLSPNDSGFIAYLKISTLDSGLKKVRISTPDSPDTCGRKPYPKRKVADSKISRYVWMRCQFQKVSITLF